MWRLVGGVGSKKIPRVFSGEKKPEDGKVLSTGRAKWVDAGKTHDRAWLRTNREARGIRLAVE